MKHIKCSHSNCSALFGNRAHMNVHASTVHNLNRPGAKWICKDCAKLGVPTAFCGSVQLKQHQKAYHPNPSDQPNHKLKADPTNDGYHLKRYKYLCHLHNLANSLETSETATKEFHHSTLSKAFQQSTPSKE